jgi:GWxTD domain-containing protein
MKKNFQTLIVLLLLGGCGFLHKISQQNVSYLYNPDIYQKTPEYLVYHNADSITFLYFKVNSLNLAYHKWNNTETYSAKFSLKVELFESFQFKGLIDSFSRSYSDTNFAFQNKELIYGSRFPLKENNYVLKAVFTDENSGSKSTTYINISKKSKNDRQNFMVLNENNVPLFNSIFPKTQHFRIKSNDSMVKKLIVDCYFRDFPIAGPPFSMPKEKPFVLKPDSTYELELIDGIAPLISLKKRGIYHFRKDTLSADGITLFHYYDDFPGITTPGQMIAPVRYISSKKEYNDIILSKDKKLGVESFWIQAAGKADKAIILIKKYYNLVQEANMFFSSYHEGWKTDRGIIYIVYGPPDIVYKTDNSETWIYGEENTRLSSRFYFYKVTNHFSDNDYNLNKSESYRESWYLAISRWRKEY